MASSAFDVGCGTGAAGIAPREKMLWFLTQEVAGEAGFDDLSAMTQVKVPVTAKSGNFE